MRFLTRASLVLALAFFSALARGGPAETLLPTYHGVYPCAPKAWGIAGVGLYPTLKMNLDGYSYGWTCPGELMMPPQPGKVYIWSFTYLYGYVGSPECQAAQADVLRDMGTYELLLPSVNAALSKCTFTPPVGHPDRNRFQDLRNSVILSISTAWNADHPNQAPPNTIWRAQGTRFWRLVNGALVAITPTRLAMANALCDCQRASLSVGSVRNCALPSPAPADEVTACRLVP